MPAIWIFLAFFFGLVFGVAVGRRQVSIQIKDSFDIRAHSGREALALMDRFDRMATDARRSQAAQAHDTMEQIMQRVNPAGPVNILGKKAN